MQPPQTPGESNTTRPLASPSPASPGQVQGTSSPTPGPPAFDPQATVAPLSTANPAAPGNHADATAAQFDPLATVVPARPAVRRTPVQADTATEVPLPTPQAAEPEPASRKRDVALVAGLAGVAAISVGVLVYLFSDSSLSPQSSPGQGAANARAPAVVAPAPAPTAAPPVAVAPAPAPMPPLAAAPSPPAPAIAAAPASEPGNAAALAPLVTPSVPPIRPTGPPAVATTGVVRFELKGGWANVFVNGEDKGVTPPVLSVKLPAGNYEVELRNPALPAVKRSVTVVAGKSATVRHSYVKELGPSPSSAKPGTTY